MKQKTIYFAAFLLMLISCNHDDKKQNANNKPETMKTDSLDFNPGYSDVNGIKMYYEIYGQGEPLVLIHGGGSTIQSSFGRIIPQLAKDYKVIAVELQNHGRSGFRDIPETFEQDADDVFALLNNLAISKANFLGFSNGGSTAMQIAIRHPEKVNKLVLLAAAYKRDGFIRGFFEGMQHATIDNMPQGLKTAFLEVTPDSAKLQTMFERDRDRMIAFKDWSDEQIRSITAPALIIDGDADVVLPEHALEMHRLLPHSQLAIIPGTHGAYIGEITTLGDHPNTDIAVSMVLAFLDKDTAAKQ